MGHIGYALALYLAKKNYEVIATYNHTKKKQFLINFKYNKIKVLKCNVKNKKTLKSIFQKYKITSVIYCSAISHDSVAQKFPKKTLDVNCYGIANILEIQNKYNFRFINLSTGSVFQDVKNTRLKITEDDTPTPKSVYASSKRLGEILITNAYKKNKNVCNLRVSWVYGPPIILEKFDPQRGPLAYILSQLFFKNKKKLIFKSGSDFEASFTYIDDVSEVIEKIINLKKINSSTYHFGSGKNYKLGDLIKFINNNYKIKKILCGPGFLPLLLSVSLALLLQSHS